MRLQDQVCIVTGGAAGIGEATVRRFVAEGARVMVADIQDDMAEAVARSLGDAAVAHHCDVTDPAQVDELVAETVRRTGMMRAELEYGRIEDIMRGGLHRFLERFLARINDLGTRIGQDFLMSVSN